MEFLFENPWLIIILIGALSSFFGGSKEQTSKKKTVKKLKPIEKPVVKKSIAPPQPKPTMVTESKNKNIYEEYKNKQIEKREEVSRLRQPKVRAVEKDQPVYFKKENIIEGIIWSEILSEPKSKKFMR